ncbi:hypothetical protein A3D03_02460 [Candidatus Gottesmanbacteria bacterium RIFCSPHIGHO2_02_FULL_40_13]|uniref:Glycosyltransferase 2-like domain-containing protein n=1 Tax=Candidatus Gottesmanbacteria bacterium RIFCSPHIGHO2_02_FULL_40_13 TaxID=1798384 RepID=A0A1F6A9Y4_9BACT|nr:MAG: hypothetical protein A3D03_02460 [Candidatus Gottesmanbacteria bacterium RIFCSPHIGHO2_02_FULL_40_13]
MKIAHIIPTYNEKENIAKMIDIINSITERHSTWTSDIIVVDDYSPDGTSSIVKKLQKKYKNVFLLSKKKEGLGKALIKGYDYAVKTLHADVVIPNDADFQWNPEDFPKLIERIENGFDVVVASRHVKGGKVIGWNWFRNLNHNVSNTLLAWWVAGVHEVKDHAGNFKAIRVKGVLDKVRLQNMKNAGFSFQLHILYELSKTGARFYEVPVTFKEREYGKSKIGFNKYYLRDIVEYIKSSLLIRYDRSRVFSKYFLVGAVGFILQTLISKLIITGRINPGLAVAIGAEGAIISNFTLNNYWTFSHKKINGIRLLSKFLQFNLASAGAILIQGFAVGTGTYVYGNQTWFIFMVLSIVLLVIPYSYFIYNNFIWKSPKNK